MTSTATQKMRRQAWIQFQKRKGERWLFQATHSANYAKLRQAFYEAFEEGLTAVI